MGFKVDTSFLRYLTMGARGAIAVIAELRAMGFQPIELERYSTANKLWSTKVKRLRLPDLLCVRTGLRVEVRAKSKLAIRVSDAPTNPERTWDAGAEDGDVIAFVPCREDAAGPVPAANAIYIEVGALRRSYARSSLRSAKAGSEGAERDRTWSSIVPSRPGEVLSVTSKKLTVRMDGSTRRQSFRLTHKHAYVAEGDRFEAGLTFLAGAPDRLADLQGHLTRRYDPLADLAAGRALDRYAAAKAIRFRRDCQAAALPLLEARLAEETDARVALEMAGTAAALGASFGEERMLCFLETDGDQALGMEAILILSEIGGGFARTELARIAGDPKLREDERRQAALWGLGKAGLRAYDALLPHIADPLENVAFHAIAAFGSDTPSVVVQRLVELLASGDPRIAPAASESLRVIGGRAVAGALAAFIAKAGPGADWGMATLGRLDPRLVRHVLSASPLLSRLEPMMLVARGANWLARDDAQVDLAFLLKQTL